jgi:hypothetical protein
MFINFLLNFSNPSQPNLGKTFTISPQMLLDHAASNGFKTKEDHNPLPTFNHIQVNQQPLHDNKLKNRNGL